ncbi:amino acid-binding protein [uncultured Methanobrevibacter sp.]|uniref:amino acid-binding protein n=1 Tax=uncultured Methanobrevibacter sp. TaxID=253161 RepID=UPI0025E25F6D|nr:amino acid-binding protein [uncultured Methanobrevibacter sp.]MCI6993537.1 amino acid-binding protein [Methanobrevibacter sp.]
MAVKQISIFIENKEGRIKKAINTLAEENINIRALSIADTTKYGILRLIVSDNEKAIDALEKDGFIVKENEVIILAVPDKPNGLNSTLAVFDENGINLEYLYAFVSTKSDEAIVVMRLENMEKAFEALENSDVKILDAEDIKDL